MGRESTVSRRRIVAMAVCLCLWAGAIGVRLIDLHVVKAAHYRERARVQHESELDISPQRGTIRDRNGKDLAISIEVDSLYAQPASVESPLEVARFLSPILEKSVDELYANLTSDRKFVYLKRKMTAAQSAAIRASGLAGLGFQKESKRFYPNVELAAHVLGPVNLDNHGVGGLEYYYDELIAGTPGTVVVQRDARKVPFDRFDRPPSEGASLTTTLDTSIQYFVEAEIGRTIRETGAVGMSVVVMEPATGAILAMANYPTFNPNEYVRSPDYTWSNRAIKHVYEPGSTFKIATAAAVLEEGVGDIDEIVDGNNGSIEVHGRRIRDHKPFGLLTLREVLQYSSNVGIIQFGTRLGDSLFAEYIERYGFGQRTGIDLMGEERGLVRPASEWSGLSSSTISMGQEIGTTPLQILNLISAVGNGGTLYRPFVVSRIDHVDGRIERTPPDGRRVISGKTAALLQDAMRRVVADGTGQAAAIPGFSSAGKTGTAQKIDPATGTYSSTRHVASFVGYAPARDPSISIVVVIDEPSGQYHGGDVAAPVFGRLATQILWYLGAQPDVPQAPRYSEEGDRDGEAPFEQSPELQIRTIGEGALVNASFSLAPAPSPAAELLQTDRVRVPDYGGRLLREVFGDTARLGLRLLSSGSGVAVAQWPAPGALVHPATAIEVRFSTSPDSDSQPVRSIP